MERYFVGGNTCRGFFSFYKAELAICDKIIFLKGAPGTGKSSLIRAVGAEAKTRGYSSEEWYCSGDSTSLDGVRINELNTVVMDATSPHDMEPTLPIVRERIFNLADALDVDKLRSFGEQLSSLLTDKKRYYSRAYSHIKCAFCNLERQNEIFADTFSKDKLRSFASSVLEDAESLKERRDLFSRAYTPQGEIAFYDHIRNKKIILIKGSNPIAKDLFFSYVASRCPAALFLHSPMDPNVVEGAVFQNLAVVTDAGQFGNDVSECLCLDMAQNADYDKAEWDDATSACEREIQLALSQLAEAKKIHSQMEKYYIAAMDFTVADKIKTAVLDDVFSDKIRKTAQTVLQKPTFKNC